jgi:hypothetical protein
VNASLFLKLTLKKCKGWVVKDQADRIGQLEEESNSRVG